MPKFKKITQVSWLILQDFIHLRTKPKTLQLPITSRCNSRCKTCNVWKSKLNIDINPEQLKKALADPFLANIENVGINGGEPTLYKNMDSLLDSLFTLKRLKTIYLISNGIYSKRLFETLSLLHSRCKKQNVKLVLTLSIDGVSEVHDRVRGISGNFSKIVADIEEIVLHKKIYCDELLFGCTISKYNIAYIPQVELFLKQYNIPIYFHLAVPNKRIGTFEEYPYSVLSDERSRLLAEEFFLRKWMEERNINKMMLYFGTYYYIKNKGKKRIVTCQYKYRDVTIDENLNFYLCATASDVIGNLNETTASELFKSGKIKSMQSEIAPLCNDCIHYQGLLTIKGIIVFSIYMLERLLCWRVKFNFLSKWK